jgi:subtilase family serine protease
MIARFRTVVISLSVVALVLTFNLVSSAGNQRGVITQKIDNSQLTTLAGNTRPEANALNDRGPVSADLPFEHNLLLLQRTPDQERQLEAFIEGQYNHASASYHHWLNAQQFGEQYGIADSDIQKITGWLESFGFRVDYVYSNKMVIDFSGTASQYEAAFHTQFHYYRVNGEDYVANASDPKIPAALAGVVAGPIYLNNFKPQAMNHRIMGPHIDPASGSLHTDYTAGGGYPLVPWDLQKIYNITPLLSAGISGQGTTIMVVEDTNQWNCLASNAPPPTGGYNICPSTSDFAVFRNTFGLGRYPSGVMKENNPGTLTTNSCTGPSTGSGYPSGSGINTDDVEATIDVEWATGAAPNATVVSAACANPRGGFGGLTAVQNTLNHPNADGVDVISMSYGESEPLSGATLNAAFNTTFQQAATAGIGVFVSSGDEDAASSDGGGSGCSGGAGGDCAKDGINISGWMSSPYDVSVGGLDFADTYLGLNSTYWNAANNVFYGSAKSYIMEQPWNDSCASTLLANYETASFITYGSTGFCNTTAGANFHLAVGGSGGPSGCATGTAAVRGVVGGTCAGWPKPSYQSSNIGLLAGLANDGVRDTPDVSLMAANGLWGHYYLVCYSDTTPGGISNGGTPCTGQPINWPGYGGTSVSSPIMAAIQALVVQHKGSLQGNPNPRYYALAASEYGPSGNPNCNSTLGKGVGSGCVFYDITLGDNDANCQAHSGGTKYNCYLPSGAVGVLSTDNNSYQPAYPTTTGWDFGTGIGSVNAYNLVMSY